MAFNGTWETVSHVGYNEFYKLLGIPDDIIEKGRDYKVISEVTQNGDNFSCKKYLYAKTLVYKFTVGKECDMETIEGKKFKVTVSMEGGMLSIPFPKYIYTCKISEGMLIETSTAGTVVLKRTSKKIKG